MLGKPANERLYMILGIGTDLVHMDRTAASIARFGERMTCRIYTPTKRQYAESRQDPIKAYPTRFAAKEALVKALGTGIVNKGVSWQHIEITKDQSGRPEIKLSDRALEHFKSLIPKGKQGRIDLSLTDEVPLAQAFVVLSAD